MKFAMQWSISSTFYMQIFLYESALQSFFFLHVTRENLTKRFLYKKGTKKRLWNWHQAAAEVEIHPNGKWIYFSNRMIGSVIAYEVQDDGNLKFLQVLQLIH